MRSAPPRPDRAPARTVRTFARKPLVGRAPIREKSRMLVGSFVLAGGRSRRMGQPKEALPFLGTTLLGHTVETLLDCTWPVLVIGRGGDQQLPPLPLEAKLVHDDRPGQGPLAAIAAGMRHVRQQRLLGERDAVFVTGCDAPFLTGRAVGWLTDQLGDHQAAVPKVGGVLQPLCAVYRLDCLPAVEALLQAGIDTPRTIAEKVRTRILDEDLLRGFDAELRFLRNVNTRDEYEQARAGGGR
jgi:molybdopterin-guanine dinucleotide biosynthesis protein A